MKKVILFVSMLTLILNQYPIVNVEANEMSNSKVLKERYFEKKKLNMNK